MYELFLDYLARIQERSVEVVNLRQIRHILCFKPMTIRS